MSIIIREATPGDASSIRNIYAPYVKNTAISFEYEVPDVDEMKERITKTIKKYPYLVAQLNGEIVGYSYASAFIPRAAYSKCAELSIYISDSFTHLGIGKTLYTKMEDKLSEMGITNLYACIAVPDEADEYLDFNSAEFHKHLGFKQVGFFTHCGYKFGRYYNMIWAEKILTTK
ncbi:MAG: GNAT family N-acetyltransferase [Clostridiales bacterium]|nr:GNAT family N-acetyltransferase [Clostridiales bacterium]